MVNIISIKEEPVTDSESTTPLHKDETNLEKEYNLKTLEIRCNHLDVVKYLWSSDKDTHVTDSTVSTLDEKSYVSTICKKIGWQKFTQARPEKCLEHKTEPKTTKEA